MLKLNASYSKKVPAEGEYSSQSCHASIEIKLPDGLVTDGDDECICVMFSSGNRTELPAFRISRNRENPFAVH